jgi:hypothetical protein
LSIMYLSDNMARDFIFPKWILNLTKLVSYARSMVEVPFLTSKPCD